MKTGPDAIVLKDIYTRLLADGGDQHWWPGETPFEVAVGAVLTQNTSWKGVEKAIANLKSAQILSAQGISAAEPAALGELIRPSGYFNVKAVRLKALAEFLLAAAAPGVSEIDRSDAAELRKRLLSVKGIGRETADSIMLYAAGVPIFVIDAYTRRIFGRLGLIDPAADYDSIRAFFEGSLDADLNLFKDFHAQIVRCAKEYCRTRPMCLQCPLQDLCPQRGNYAAAEP